jgi:hypothetical protein
VCKKIWVKLRWHVCKMRFVNIEFTVLTLVSFTYIAI